LASDLFYVFRVNAEKVMKLCRRTAFVKAALLPDGQSLASQKYFRLGSEPHGVCRTIDGVWLLFLNRETETARIEASLLDI
jgi:hypothetical protein